MARYSEAQRRTRLGFDFLTCTEMARRSELLSLAAFASAADLRAGQGAVVDPADGHRALHYLAVYHPLKTLCGPGEFMDKTSIHIDLAANSNYPFSPPASWVIGRMPWSPHFKQGAVVCIGDLWDVRGTTLLAHLIRHHARLLNWDERERGGGYIGWNGEAITWHRVHYGDRPLTAQLVYPELPTDIVYGVDSAPMFHRAKRGSRRNVAKPDDQPLFGTTRRRR